MKSSIVAIAWLVTLATAFAAEPSRVPSTRWPHWRGPLATGFAPNADPPVQWDATRNIKWKAAMPSRGSATPIVWDDQVFIVTATETDRVAKDSELPKRDARFETRTEPPKKFYRFEVHSFDRNTGQLRWTYLAAEKVPHEGHHSTHTYAAGSPTTDGQRLYVSFGSFGIYCLSLDGKLIWQHDLGRLHTRLAWGEAVTPVVHGESVILNWDQEADSALICLDAKSGDTRWSTPRDERTSWNTPLVIEHKGRTQVVVNAHNFIRSYDLSTGKELWRCGGMTVNPIPSPVASDGIVYVMSGYQGAAAVAISLDAVGDVTNQPAVRWKHTRGTPYVPSPVLWGNRICFTAGKINQLTLLDLASGKPLIDRERLTGADEFYASPIAAAGRLYLVDRSGTTFVLKQSDRLEVLAINRLDDPIDASPVAVGKQLFLRGDKYLYCVENQ